MFVQEVGQSPLSTIFCMVFIQSCFILNYYYSHLESFPRLKNKIFYISIGINTLLFLSVLIQIMLIMLFRLSFAGRVCSGEFLSDEERQKYLGAVEEDSDSAVIYLIVEGRNLLAVIIVELILLPAVGLAIKLRRPHLRRMAHLKKI